MTRPTHGGYPDPRGRRRDTPAIISPRGHLSNHHFNTDGSIGERVTRETASHIIVLQTDVITL